MNAIFFIENVKFLTNITRNYISTSEYDGYVLALGGEWLDDEPVTWKISWYELKVSTDRSRLRGFTLTLSFRSFFEWLFLGSPISLNLIWN